MKLLLTMVIALAFMGILQAQNDSSTAPAQGQNEAPGTLQWVTNFKQACETATEHRKLLLVNFTGSDWCGWCIRLEKEVFSKPEFQTYANREFVCVKLDFPKKTQLAEALKQQNQELKTTYKIKGYPTVLIMNSEGKVVFETGYEAGGPEAYVKHLEAAIQKYKEENQSAGKSAERQ